MRARALVAANSLDPDDPRVAGELVRREFSASKLAGYTKNTKRSRVLARNEKTKPNPAQIRKIAGACNTLQRDATLARGIRR